MSRAAQQLKAFSQAGGQVLFGTDVGYIDMFGTSEEFAWMSRAGMNFSADSGFPYHESRHALPIFKPLWPYGERNGR